MKQQTILVIGSGQAVAQVAAALSELGRACVIYTEQVDQFAEAMQITRENMPELITGPWNYPETRQERRANARGKVLKNRFEEQPRRGHWRKKRFNKKYF